VCWGLYLYLYSHSAFALTPCTHQASGGTVFFTGLVLLCFIKSFLIDCRGDPSPPLFLKENIELTQREVYFNHFLTYAGVLLTQHFSQPSIITIK